MSFPIYYPEAGDTLPIFFATYDGGTGASITMTGLAVTDIEIYKDGSVTQRASDSGFALIDTDGIDVDGITGIHGFTLDLSDNTDAGFYTVGSWYHVVVSAVTVDSQTVSFIAAAFRILSATRGMAGTALPDAAADAAGGLPISDAGGLDLDGLNTNVSAILDDTGTSGVLVSSGTGAGQVSLSSGAVTVGTNNDKAGYSISGTLTTLDALDTAQDTQHSTTQAAISALNDPTAAAIADAVWDELQSAHTTVGSFGEIATEIASILDDTDLIDDGTSGLAKIATDVAAILVDTADIQPKLGTVTDLGGGATIAANLSDVAGATFSTSTDSLEAIRDRGDAAWTTGAGGTPPQLLQSTTIATLASQTSFTLTAGSADDDAYNGAVIVVTDQSTSTQKAVGSISDYVGSTRTVTLSADPGIFTMAVGDSVAIIAALGSAGSGPTAAQIADAVWDEAQVDHATAGTFGEVATEIAAILDDTGTSGVLVSSGTGSGQISLSSGTVTVGTNSDKTGYSISGTITTLDALDTAQDTQHSTTQAAIAALNDPTAAAIADAVWDEVQSGHVAAGSFGEIATEIAEILTDTGTTIPATLSGLATSAALATVDTNVDAILVDTGTTIPAQITALNDLSVADVWTTALTESYKSAGSAGTAAQMLFEIVAGIHDFSISGTTKTIRNLAGTAAKTYTLDSGTTPTSITEAT